jgi:hypothetical protein
MRALLENIVGISVEALRKDWILESGQFHDVVEYALFDHEFPLVRDRLVARLQR